MVSVVSAAVSIARETGVLASRPAAQRARFRAGSRAQATMVRPAGSAENPRVGNSILSLATCTATTERGARRAAVPTLCQFASGVAAGANDHSEG